MFTRFIVLLFALAPALLMAATGAQEWDIVESAIAPIFVNLNPKADLSYSEETGVLMALYRARSYKVHRSFKSSGNSEETYDETGPDYRGFVLRVSLENQGEPSQLGFRRNTFQEEFWKTDTEITPLFGTPKQITWNLSYGSNTDAKLLSELRQALRELSKPLEQKRVVSSRSEQG